MDGALKWVAMVAWCLMSSAAVTTANEPGSRSEGAGGEQHPRVYTHWESFYKKDGLPSDKAFCIAVDEDRVWAGTDNGRPRPLNATSLTHCPPTMTQPDAICPPHNHNNSCIVGLHRVARNIRRVPIPQTR